jgi:hypothetical protein
LSGKQTPAGFPLNGSFVNASTINDFIRIFLNCSKINSC